MKLKALTLSLIALASMSSSYAGTLAKNPAPPPAPVKEEPFVTGSLALMYETHFVSYGQDVWGGGNSWNDALFHPSLELDFNLGGGWQAYLNTWWDVNSLGVTTIGSNIQEVDINAGFYYTAGKWKFQLGYGSWNYGGQTEHIVDGKVSYNDGVINPFLMLHGRVADGISFDTGLVTQVGIAPAVTAGPVSFSFPVTVSFDTENFHGGDAGFAYVSAGIAATVPLTKHISLTVAGTYYHTEDSVIPVNPDSDFVLGTAGITVSF